MRFQKLSQKIGKPPSSGQFSNILKEKWIYWIVLKANMKNRWNGILSIESKGSFLKIQYQVNKYGNYAITGDSK